MELHFGRHSISFGFEKLEDDYQLGFLISWIKDEKYLQVGASFFVVCFRLEIQ